MKADTQPADKKRWMKPTQRVQDYSGKQGTITEVVAYKGTEYIDWLEVRFDHLKQCLPMRPDSVKPINF